LNKDKYDIISIDDIRTKIKETKEAEEGEGDEKPITDHEVFDNIKKNLLTETNNKIKVFTDLVKDNNLDRYHDLCH